MYIKNEINDLETVNEHINRKIRYFSNKSDVFGNFLGLVEYEYKHGLKVTKQKNQLERIMKDIDAKNALMKEYRLQEEISLRQSIHANEAIIYKKKEKQRMLKTLVAHKRKKQLCQQNDCEFDVGSEVTYHPLQTMFKKC